MRRRRWQRPRTRRQISRGADSWPDGQRRKGRLVLMREARDAARFENELDEWERCCVTCMIHEGDDVHPGTDECPKKGLETWELFAEGIETIDKEMFERKRFVDFSACFGCGLPQAIC